MTQTIQTENRLSDIKLILRDLLKVIKVVTMYPENNSLPESLRRSFCERMFNLIDEFDGINFAFEHDEVIYEHEVAFKEKSKEDNLAGLFFGAGISELIFKPTTSEQEIDKFLSTIKAFLNSNTPDRDLVAQLWEADLQGIEIRTIEDISMSEFENELKSQEFLSADDSRRLNMSQLRVGEIDSYDSIFFDSADESNEGNSLFDINPQETDEYKTDQAVEAMGYSDITASSPSRPDTALILNDEYRLSEEEQTIIKKLLENDAGFDLWESTANLIKEMLLQEEEMSSFYETVTISEKVISEFVRSGQLSFAGDLLSFLGELRDRIASDRPLWAERLTDARMTAGSRERLHILATALNEQESISVGELTRFLAHFDWQALSAMADLLGELQHRHHREGLRDFLMEKGKDNPDLLSKGLYDKRWYVVRNTVTILAKIGDDRCLHLLKDASFHEDKRVRFEVVKSLAQCTNPKALEFYKIAVLDKDAQVRREAVNRLKVARGPEAFRIIAETINHKDFVKLDHSDQSSLFIAFSVLGGDRAVTYLCSLILRYNFMRNSTIAFYRRIAFEALAHNRGERARKMLKKLASNWRPDIKRQAQKALRAQQELISRGMR